jgi:hypothetical protein
MLIRKTHVCFILALLEILAVDLFPDGVPDDVPEGQPEVEDMKWDDYSEEEGMETDEPNYTPLPAKEKERKRVVTPREFKQMFEANRAQYIEKIIKFAQVRNLTGHCFLIT